MTHAMKRTIAYAFFVLTILSRANAQNTIYKSLPMGKYPVGFRIFTIDDFTRAARPPYNYMGERNVGERQRKITIHLWYPAKANSGKPLSFGDYCYNALLTSTQETIAEHQKVDQINGKRAGIERWWGKTTDDNWKKLVGSTMIAMSDAKPEAENFPLLIGMLRPLSTTLSCEMMASNGYVVAMVKGSISDSFAEGALQEIPDMQHAISYLTEKQLADTENLGVFGFSGSGFTPFLFSNYDMRVRAYADIESGLYMEGLFQGLSQSNFYKPAAFRAPFLHLFSRDLSKQEVFLHEFEKKTKFAKRYRVVLNQPAMHHWDFATEGYTASLMLQNRGSENENIMRAYEIASHYLLAFFNAELKNDEKAKTFMAQKQPLAGQKTEAWDFYTYAKVNPAPTLAEFENIIRTNGIQAGLKVVNDNIWRDSTSSIWTGFRVNQLGYTFLNEKKTAEAIEVFKLNTQLHPQEANFFDSLAEAYEATGDAANSKKTSETVLALLAPKTTLSDLEKGLKANAEKRIGKNQ